MENEVQGGDQQPGATCRTDEGLVQSLSCTAEDDCEAEIERADIDNKMVVVRRQTIDPVGEEGKAFVEGKRNYSRDQVGQCSVHTEQDQGRARHSRIPHACGAHTCPDLSGLRTTSIALTRPPSIVNEKTLRTSPS